MNITLIIVFLIIVLAAVHGFKRGMTKELSSLIAWAVTLFVMSLVIMLYTSFHSGESKNTVFTIIILVVVVSLYSMIRFFLKPIKLIAKLPLFRFLDQMLGLAVGIAEGFLIVWLIYILNESGAFGQFGEMIKNDTLRSEILSYIYKYNYLIKIAKGF